MKAKYRFSVSGHLKPTFNKPINLKRYLLEFGTNKKGLVTHIDVTVKADNKEHWPSIEESPNEKVAVSINIKEPNFLFIQKELRSIEGLLSLYGVHSINILNPELEWIPENEAERNELEVYSYKIDYQDMADEEAIPIPFDILARSVIAALDTYDIEIFLSFFRKGKTDVYYRRYIEAIYDFYFLFESLFAEGKSKNHQVEKTFKKSLDFTSCIKAAIKEPNFQILGDPKLKKEFSNKYQNKNVNENIDYIVNLRGFLHHHSSKRKNIWHPENHQDFKLDALMFQGIAFNVVFQLSEKFVFSENVKKIYQELMKNN